jgi:hypothetical protein
MMKGKQGIFAGWVILFLLGMGTQPVLAGDFDGSKPLLCAMIEAFECGPDTGCESGTPESNGLSRFLRVDVGKKEVCATKESQERTSKIEKVDHAEGVLLLSGTQNGRGWNLNINESAGYMVLSVAGDQVAFVVFGACTRP